MSPSNLAQLTRQAGSGDAEARRTFEQKVVPLVETVVRRWQKRRSRELTQSGNNLTGDATSLRTVSVEEARRATRAVCARLIRRFMSPTRGMARPHDETLVAPRLLDTYVVSEVVARG